MRSPGTHLYTLKPTVKIWVPHIACNIVTRQIVFMGDPPRRSADLCESFGAMIKDVIKHLQSAVVKSVRRLSGGELEFI